MSKTIDLCWEDSTDNELTLFDQIFNSKTARKFKLPHGKMFMGRKCKAGPNRWCPAEKARFLAYLQENFGVLEEQWGKPTRQAMHLAMSSYIRTKDYAQCRQYHHRMMRKHSSLEGLVLHLRRQRDGRHKLSEFVGLRVEQSYDLPLSPCDSSLFSVLNFASSPYLSL